MLRRLAGNNGFHLSLKLREARLTRTGDGLIGACDHGLDRRKLCKPRDGHKGDDCGAVLVCDNALVFKGVRAVYLRDNQRHIFIKPESGAVIDIHRAALDYRRGEALGHAVLHRAEDIVHACEALVSRFFDKNVLTVEFHIAARAARACKRKELCDGDIVFLKDFQHLSADSAACAEDRYIDLFHFISSLTSKSVIQHADCRLIVLIIYTNDY